MNEESKTKQVISLFERIVNKYIETEKKPQNYGTEYMLHRSDVHMIEAIENNKDINVTKLAQFLGITKGAVSQKIDKLINKNFIEKQYLEGNDKEIRLKLTDEGRKIYNGHNEYHENFYKMMDKEISGISDEDLDRCMEIMNNLEKILDKR